MFLDLKRDVRFAGPRDGFEKVSEQRFQCMFVYIAAPRALSVPLPRPHNGKWVRERYVATKSDNSARYAEREITGVPRLELDPRCSVVQSVAPAFDRAALSISGDREVSQTAKQKRPTEVSRLLPP